MTEGSDSGKAPREWWINKYGVEIVPNLHSRWVSEIPIEIKTAEYYHVIEKSAYNQLAQELALVKAAKEVPTTNAGWPHEKKLHEELAEVKEQWTEAVQRVMNIKQDWLEARAEIAKLQKDNLLVVSIGEKLADERDELRAEVERLTNAAERHRSVAAERLQIIDIYENALKEYAPMEEWYESFADQKGSLGKIAQDALAEAGKVGE